MASPRYYDGTKWVNIGLPFLFGVATGAANTYAVTVEDAANAYYDGMMVIVGINVTNTSGTCTLNVNGLGAKQITKNNASGSISVGELTAGSPYIFIYRAGWYGGNGGWGLVAGNMSDYAPISYAVARQTSLANNIDLNTVTTSGFYRINSGSSNAPGGSVSWGQLIVSMGGGDTITQIYSAYDSNDMWYRSGYGIGGTPTWTAWAKFYSSGSKPTPPEIGAVTKGILHNASEVNVVNRATGIYSIRGYDPVGWGISYYTLYHNVDQEDSNYAQQTIVATQNNNNPIMFVRLCTAANTWGGWYVQYSNCLKPALTDIATEGTHYCGIDSNNSGKINPARASAAERDYNTNITLGLADAGCLLRMYSGSAQTVTIPTNASVAFPVNTEIEICRWAAGSVTISPAGGVTIACADAARTISATYATISLKKVETDVWLLTGNLG